MGGVVKIGKKTRERAARLCSMCACFGEPISISRAVSLLHDVEPVASRRMLVARVAVRAWDAANRKLNRATDRVTNSDTIRDDHAEAEAMLRTGWAP